MKKLSGRKPITGTEVPGRVEQIVMNLFLEKTTSTHRKNYTSAGRTSFKNNSDSRNNPNGNSRGVEETIEE